ncbi:MAG: hypothetical protein HUU35_13195, partial [Armatimonadetes bacterium]|nr:hypothetical protein [Armatimonadota bacterium]
WPPQASGAQALAPVALAPLNDSQAWQMPTPADNPSGKRAVTTAERVEFDVPSEGWNEFMHSNPQKLVLQPETTYRLQYDYTVLREASGGEGATFYQLVRTGAAPVREDVGWQNWTDPAGATGRRVVTFTTRAFPSYYLIFGVRHSGAIRLENIRLWRLPKSEG